MVVAALVAAVARSGELDTGAAQLPAPTIVAYLHPGPEARAGALSITIDGLRESRGTVLVGLYDSRASFDRAIELASDTGFLNDPDRVAGAALRANGMLRGGVTFRNLPPGRYAVILFHDEHGNGRLDKNFWGVPTEPYGFSNDAQGILGPPSFEEAALSLDGSDRAIAIDLVYHAGGFEASPQDDAPPSASAEISKNQMQDATAPRSLASAILDAEKLETPGKITRRDGADGSTAAHSGSKARISRIRIFGSALQW
jgi:uncharacterized protein (DUF2141 family)